MIKKGVLNQNLRSFYNFHAEEDPDAPGMGKLSFQMQTLEQTAEQEQKLKDAMKYATPDQLKETLFIFLFLKISSYK